MTDTRIYLREDTIAAPSTPPGKGAVAVIRVSGPDAIALCERIFRSRGPRLSDHPRRMMYGTLEDPATREPVDNGLCVVFPAPRSYTGENMAEIHTHGSEAVVRQLLEILYREGARPAEPGEFTFRAVRNGKLDLAQAEGVANLIESRTRLARAMSLRVLEGEFSRDLARIKDAVVSALVEIETQIEFPGEAEDEAVGHQLRERMQAIQAQAEVLRRRWVREQRFAQGIVVVLAGRPNVGKSSLFNRLLGRERAIVTPHPGTTRDSLEGTIELQGRPVTLVDTAGLRETREEIEAIGVRRSRELLSTSHIVLYICEAAGGLVEEDRAVLKELKNRSRETRVVIVINKCDIAGKAWMPPVLDSINDTPVARASAVAEGGADELLAVLEREVARLLPGEADSAYLVSARQENLLSTLVERTAQASLLSKNNSPLELAAVDLRAALQAIAELDGAHTAPDILETIFSRFCIGK